MFKSPLYILTVLLGVWITQGSAQKSRCNVRDGSCSTPNTRSYIMDPLTVTNNGQFFWLFQNEPVQVALEVDALGADIATAETLMLTLSGLSERKFQIHRDIFTEEFDAWLLAESLDRAAQPQPDLSEKFIEDVLMMEGGFKLTMDPTKLTLTKASISITFNLKQDDKTSNDVNLQKRKLESRALQATSYTSIFQDSAYTVSPTSYKKNGVSTLFYDDPYAPFRLYVALYDASSGSLNILLQGKGVYSFSYKNVIMRRDTQATTLTNMVLSAEAIIATQSPNTVGSMQRLMESEAALRSLMKTLQSIRIDANTRSMTFVSSSYDEISLESHRAATVVDLNQIVASTQIKLRYYRPGFLEILASDGQNENMYNVVLYTSSKYNNVLSVTREPGTIASEAFNNNILKAVRIEFDRALNTLSLDLGGGITYKYTLATYEQHETPVKTYKYLLDSYFEADQSAVLFKDKPWNEQAFYLKMFETKPGIIIARFELGNSLDYTFKFQVKDGWILERYPHYTTYPRTVDTGVAYAEARLTELLNQVNQISYNDKVLQFISYDAAKRIAFVFESSTNDFSAFENRATNNIANIVSPNAIPTQAVTTATQDTPSHAVNTDMYDIKLTTWDHVGSLKLVLTSSAHSITYTFDVESTTNMMYEFTIIRSSKKIDYRVQPDKVKISSIQKEILDLLDRANKLMFEKLKSADYNILTIYAGERRMVLYSATPLTVEVVSSHPLAGQTVTYGLLPATFTPADFDSRLINSYPPNPQPCVNFEVYKLTEGQIRVTLSLGKLYTYNIHYQPHDGWVLKVQTTTTERSAILPLGVTYEIENHLHRLMIAVQQVSFESDGTLQIISEFGAKRLLMKVVPKLEMAGVEKPFDAMSLYNNNNLLFDLYVPSVASCYIYTYLPGSLHFGCHRRSELNEYKVTYDDYTKRVISINEIAAGALPLSTKAEILSSYSVQITNNRFTLITRNNKVDVVLADSHRSFLDNRPMQNQLVTVSILPLNFENQIGAFDGPRRKLQSNSPVQSSLNRSIDMFMTAEPGVYISENTLSGINDGFTSITTTDGTPKSTQITAILTVNEQNTFTLKMQVNDEYLMYSIVPQPGSPQTVTLSYMYSNPPQPQTTSTITSLRNLIDASLKDLQVTQHGINMIFAVPTSNGLSQQSLIFKKHTVGKYAVQPETYMAFGNYQTLYDSGLIPYPIMISLTQNNEGEVKLTLYGKKMYSFIYNIQHHDGWVLNIQEVSVLPITSTTYQQPYDIRAELKLYNLLQRLQQFAFENSGLLQLITDHGATRIAFQNIVQTSSDAYLTPSYSLGQKALQPQTYVIQNQQTPLYVPSHPIFIQVEQLYSGAIKVFYTGIRKFTIVYEYQAHDGWVTFSYILGNQYTADILRQYPAEKAIIDILEKTQQIAFEGSGQLQFIADYGATRISFQ